MSDVVFISFYPGFMGINLRILGACLKKAGFSVEYLHLGFMNYKQGNRFPTLVNFDNPDYIVEKILPFLDNALFAGISLASSEFNAARDFTIALKKRSTLPVVWGGPHPTASYESCVPFADYVCIGEGEDATVEIAHMLQNKKDIGNIRNLAYLKNGTIVVNPVRPVIGDLNSLPVNDTDIHTQRVFLNGEFQLLSPELLVDLDRIYIRPVPDRVIYITTLTRGCPYSCTYCNNSYLKRIYSGQKFFRYRSLDHLFSEIKQAMKDIKNLGVVFLADDNITTLPADVLNQFARRWKDEIGLPFGTSGSPITLKEEKLDILVKTGLLYKFGVGIESGSERILQVYNRKESIKQAVAAINMVEKYRNLFFQKHERPNINYQFIFDNPYENNADIAATLRFIIKYIQDRKSLTVFSLVMYPGSEIYHQARQDGLIASEQDIYTESFADLKPSFAKVWLILYIKGMPAWLLGILAMRFVFTVFNSYPFNKIYKKVVPQILT